MGVQMYNPRVQIYGDVAILTYIESVEGKLMAARRVKASCTGKGYDGVYQAGRRVARCSLPRVEESGRRLSSDEGGCS